MSTQQYQTGPFDDVMQQLGTGPKGLSSEEARRRLGEYGPNSIEEEGINKLAILARQFMNVLVYILVLAAAVAALLGDLKDVVIIVLLIFINGGLGFWQEMRAEVSVRALKRLTESQVRVLRDGRMTTTPSTQLVPGDIVVKGDGDVVTADARLLESYGLMVDESSITGESLPVLKDHSLELAEDARPYELKNMLLSGTTVVKGTGRAVVVSTGQRTYFASIADRVREKAPESPLTRAVNSFSRRYVALLLGVMSLIGFVGILQGRGALDVAYNLVAQLVSAVPEGLPIVITMVLVLGAMALSRRGTMVRSLPAVETLGSTTVIATDKTGTVTQGRLAVQEHEAVDEHGLRLVAALCNDSESGIGDPVDVALARWVDEDYETMRERHPRVGYHPFDTAKRYMATVNNVDGGWQLFMKGSFEVLSSMVCNTDDVARLEGAVTSMSERGLRVLAMGIGGAGSDDPNTTCLRLVGVVGFLDPPKEGVREAVLAARRAGVRVLMITGDHALTARSIAGDIGIWREGEGVLTGDEMDGMDDASLLEALSRTSVLARTVPDQKYRVVRVLQSDGEIVAVTGDGVNDVPALKVADLGIAMGEGTEAAKSVSKMVILDNNLRVIVDAIRNGRVIANNIRKVIYYLISTSLGEIALISSAIITGLPLPLHPTQILWVNLVTDGVQDKTFPLIKAEGEVMEQPPKDPRRQFLDRSQILRVVYFSLLMGAVGLGLFTMLLERYDEGLAVSITFTSVVVFQWFNGFQAQKESEPFFMNLRRSLTVNPYIFLGAGIGLGLQVVALYAIPSWFDAEPLGPFHWLLVLVAGLVVFMGVEARKWAELALGESRRAAQD